MVIVNSCTLFQGHLAPPGTPPHRLQYWIDDGGPAALVIREHLIPVEGADGVFFPATYAAQQGADKDKERDKERDKGPWVQVARQGNPLFNEGLVAIVDKDLYGRTSPETDGVLFRKYAENPELGALINAFLLGGGAPQIATGRTDIAAIYIPDLIKVDLSTTGTHLTATGGDDPAHGP